MNSKHASLNMFLLENEESLKKKSAVPTCKILQNTVVPRSNKILVLKALLKPTLSLKSELSTTVLYLGTDLLVEVKLMAEAGWESPCWPQVFNRSLLQVRSL